MAASLDSVVYQHVENACALWWMRHMASAEPHYSLTDLARLDDRLETNLDGLRIAGEHARPILDELLSAEDPGSLFTCTLLALEGGHRDLFEGYLDRLRQHPERLGEMVSALAWTDPANLRSLVKRLLGDEEPSAVRLGLAACSAHGRPPRESLGQYAEHADERVRCAAVRLAADTGQHALVTRLAVDRATGHLERYETARALAFLGESGAAGPLLEALAAESSTVSRRATALRAMLGDSGAGHAFLSTFQADPSRAGDVINGFGCLGDPAAIDWLIERCAPLDTARAAGAAITMITGVDLDAEELTLRQSPDAFEPFPGDDPDDDASVDEEENLPWPDVAALLHWREKTSGLHDGTLYLDGRKKSPAAFERTLVEGAQWQRRAAAAQLAMTAPDTPYVDVRLPSGRQRERLARVRAARG